ncbi:tRNA (adenosine(37)-N6)-threonylcarbamoyltransferase complex dimerization subunit type 1 TsaB [Sphingomicrobium sp. XHP0239]|uniref:tRNA (adenosine(37)-N6)-threonylcarbamoyltransferase complex dimerization subunit type 1 TsaB n=1 Tax=Sphingomicrobium maritimum TaxID=3133972 RepID=UPI0031CC8DC9
MILAIETSTGMCSTALIEGGEVLDAREERIGRGHAERLVPMIDELLGSRVPTHILVSAGPGSFTGIRVGIAAAQGLSIGWQVPVTSFSSLALLAAAARSDHGDAADVTAVMQGGHGELFVQGYGGDPLTPVDAPQSLVPNAAATTHDRDLLAGPAAEALAEAGASGSVMTLDPLARYAALLPPALTSLAPMPLYVRAPDAKPKAA